MAKPEWGSKRTCQECGAKFYDMRRAEVVCPKCNAPFAQPAAKGRRPSPEIKSEVEKATLPKEPASAASRVPDSEDEEGEAVEDDLDELEDIDVQDEDVEEDEDMIEDTSDLGDDDDDMAEVIQKPDGPRET